MSLAAAQDTTVYSTLNVPQINIAVNVDDNYNITCNPPFARVGVNFGAMLIWTLTAPADVFFDTPAITMFGENANIAWQPPGPTQVSAVWVNDAVHSGRSYCYRIHLLRQSGDSTNPTYTPLTMDPIIHNDPPPQP